MVSEESREGVERLMETPDLASALESDLFKQFLDQAPVAVAVAELNPSERIVYANEAFLRLIGQELDSILGGRWEGLPGTATAARDARTLAEAVGGERDFVGSFTIPRSETNIVVDAWSNVIEDDAARAVFRLVALVETTGRDGAVLDELQELARVKDLQLQELQHRVKNNLQMITALIRLESKGLSDRSLGDGFDRLAGRVEALGLLYHALTDTGLDGAVDLGVYLSEIASAVMRAHAVEGIHLNLQVDTWLVTLDVAMPVGLVVNELLTNSLKHAFKGRDGGTITLHSLNAPEGCQVIVADDGIGLAPGDAWPRPGKLSALIVRSLLQNARASIDVQSAPGAGVQVTMSFRNEDAAPSV
ncbi:sensor histidine kinase [Phenylobacterium aquaticum]|uniref:sensor histidine kinase n=1 Tax=Phenylobacterium aquaticum TaxID=1763816 RepID=UPI001F5CA5A5|nr:sensor histidine kinase [Phenylobacterium aquaticum]MCI3134777.1 PAS domain-containing protein [Phenylobacterium aquaticum]